MKKLPWGMVVLVLIAQARAADEPTVALREPWDAPYTGKDAVGDHVLGLWHFNSAKQRTDESKHRHGYKLEGARVVKGGRFGACLESFAGWPVADKRHAAIVENSRMLSPKGAFTVELWIKPNRDPKADYPQSFLLDKKYVSHDDYQLILDGPNHSGVQVLRMNLGFGDSTSTWTSESLRLEPDQWRHVAFTYDGKGTGAFYLNGMPWGAKHVEGRGPISAGKHPLSIGDRIGSLYSGFPGFIDEVRISSGVREFRQARFQRISDRTCFVRMEPKATVQFAVTNLQRVPMEGATAAIGLEGMTAREMEVKPLAPGETATIDYPIDTGLRPDSYRLAARLRGLDKTSKAEAKASELPESPLVQETFFVRIVPRPTPNRFPVLMWGVGSGFMKEMPRLKEIGFTHVLGSEANYEKIWKAGAATEPDTPNNVAETKQALDEALANDMGIVAALSPGAWLRSQEQFQRVDRHGKHAGKAPDICGLIPGVDKFCYNVGASVAGAYGHFPAFRAAMIHTEVRDDAGPCFHEHDLEAFRKASGIDVPLEVVGKWGVPYKHIAGFPADRVIPDDQPIYRYYQWYWKHGDGWNALNTAVHQGLKSTGRTDLWTYHDPAVRVASVYGSGGAVDFLSQWTYSYPDPIRIGLATDELLAMAAGAPQKQQVMKMTQIIWYRSQTAPPPKPGAAALPYQARWELDQPDAQFITIAPMHLREAFWTKIARPIKGIMYHGWESLVPVDRTGGYRYTNPETQHELARLVQEVVRPLGPTLLSVPAVKSDVAFLESFASTVFAQRGTYGWCGGWIGDAYHVMLYAHLQPEVVYDETIVNRGLDGFRVLVMADCDVITAKMVERIKAFQARGGLVVGDDHLAPAIKPDIVLKPYQRTGRDDQDKAALVALAAGLREQLDKRYSRYLDSSVPDIVPYQRRYRETDYVFAVNDRREYGQYVGQHGIVMENGVDSQGSLSLGRPGGFVYDLVEHRGVAAQAQDGRLTVPMRLGPCDGRLLMVTPRAIGQVRIDAPQSVPRGGQATCTIAVLDAEGQPLDAVIPLEVDIRDVEGRPAEFSGYYAAIDGKAQITLDIAANDPFGVWQIAVRELAAGHGAVRAMRVMGPKQWPPVSKPLAPNLANPVQPKG